MTTEFTLDIRETLGAFQRVERELDSAMARAMRGAVDLVASEAQTSHEYQDRTGHLSASIGGVSSGEFSKGTLEGVVSASVPHAASIEFGSRAHRIEPRHRTVLRFPSANGFAFSKGVNHPGTRAYAFIGNALEHLTDDIAEEFAAAVDIAFDKAGLG